MTRELKIIEKRTEKIIGIIDFNLDVNDETYLSLLMIHSDFQGKGIGKLIFHGFEEYANSFKSKCIRIDVVTNYDNSVLDFWAIHLDESISGQTSSALKKLERENIVKHSAHGYWEKR